MIVYKTTNLINGKIYVGQTKTNNENYYGSGKLIKQAIKKYGKDNFYKEILCKCNSIKRLNEMEIYWIKKLNSTNNTIGYNLENGGSDNYINKKRKKGDYVFTETHKINISKGLKGKPKSSIHRLRVSLNHHDVSGKNNPMFGKNHSSNIIEASRIRATGKTATIATRIKMSTQRRGDKNSNAKLTEKDVIKIRNLYFNKNKTISELSKKYNVNPPCIDKIVKRRTWKYLE